MLSINHYSLFITDFMNAISKPLENPIVAQDIKDLKDKIMDYALGKLRDDEFRGIRTARGVYSQRLLRMTFRWPGQR